jgi:hypothetical protein
MSVISDCTGYFASTLVLLGLVLLLVSILRRREIVSTLLTPRRGASKPYRTVVAIPAWLEQGKAARLAGAMAALVYSVFVGVVAVSPAHTQSPIKIGFSMALTGGLSPNGRSGLIP